MRKEDLFNAISEINPEYIERIDTESKKTKNNISLTFIAAAIALLIATPLLANAATDGEYFNRIWGTLSRKNIASHEEILRDEEKNQDITIVYPQREFVDIEPETANDLIGDYVEHHSIVREVDGITITVLSIVRDDNNAVVVEFTMEKEDGIDFLNYSQLDNEAKGAWFSDNSTCQIMIGNDRTSGMIYVDLEKSTDEKLYCYNYLVCNGIVWLKTFQYPCTLGEYRYENAENHASIQSEIEEHSVYIPCESSIETVTFSNVNDGVIDVSPISLKIDYSLGLDVYDSYGIYKVLITYSDGSTYLVEEHNYLDIHSCDVETANYSYSCSDLNNVYYVFNRLVDVNNVTSITVNDVVYTR